MKWKFCQDLGVICASQGIRWGMLVKTALKIDPRELIY